MLRPAILSAAGLCSVAALFAQLRPASPAKPAGAPAALSFNEHIQPILADNCYACHGLDSGSRKAELRLDRFEHATAKRKDGPPAIIPGKPHESPLIQRIESKSEKKVKPPPESHKTLTAGQISTLRRWVAEGAHYEEHWA
ncbi:MAG: c-type cytochrome domain-containing protein, partial [Opitutaceae bacterium]